MFVSLRSVRPRISSLITGPTFRGLKTLTQLPYSTEDGLSPLYSKEALHNIYNVRQSLLLNRVNELSQDTTFGHENLTEIVKRSSVYPEHIVLYNNASQAWNTLFFLKSLRKNPSQPSNIVQKTLSMHYGSFEGFKNIFKQYAKGIFGNGWTWLAIDNQGKLLIKNTYNGASLFSIIPENSEGPISISDKDLYKRIKELENGKYPTQMDSFSPLKPILCLNMWMDSYMFDFGYDKDRYIDSFWDVVNWDVVEQRLINSEQSNNALY
ncbi:Superoxide dismutase [Fe] [Zancudomyces culisetae]|uniref:Superoxide dismutase [Fe] n=1 Tax=Zancudomyces culisetae TaxID=1213189 RepID=A0A1R1PQC1_ZANCU|nr:Superoxide dismutase [Fe] [Zancudomyces culisetae]|eukprot:OMH83103.1 Superoxide dismutase [Fe] [Zancudomyces culisetae]